MQERGKLINRLALVLLSIVVLELILIGDQVQPVKAIKKKILLKKLKKVLPLLALVKPKKKIILVPIPFPMFNKNPRHPYDQSNMRPMTMITDGLQPPNSFTMIPAGSEPGLVGVGLGPMPMPMPMQMQMQMPMTMGEMLEPAVAADDVRPLMVPSMTMTIQSDASGGSNIELSMQNSTANLQQRPGKWAPSQAFQQQQLFDHQFDEPPGGEQYYSSPWLTGGRPLSSPAKLLRNERLRKQQQQQHQQQQQQQQHQQQLQHQKQPPTTAAPVRQTISVSTQQPARQTTSGRLQQQQQQSLMPVLVIKNQWRPTTSQQPPAPPQHQQHQQPQQPTSGRQQVKHFNNQDPFQRQIQQQINQALEMEELVPVGPPQLMPIYQSPNGQLHISPPGQAGQQQASPKGQHQQQHQQQQQQQQQQQLSQVTLDQSSFEHEEPLDQRPPVAPSPAPTAASTSTASSSNASNNNNDAEVQTIGGGGGGPSGNLHEGPPPPPPPADEHRQPPGQFRAPSSPAVKGKQQQQQVSGAKRRPSSAGGY